MLPYLIMYPPIFKGLSITASILIIPMVFLSYFMTGSIWDYDFCKNSSDPENCTVSIFDNIAGEYKLSDEKFDLIRKGRTGLAILTIGLYLVFTMASVLVQRRKSEELIFQKVSYEKNIWIPSTWNRDYYIIIVFSLAFHYTIYMHYTYTSFFGNNLWYGIIFIKISQIVVEYFLAKVKKKKNQKRKINLNYSIKF
jgi:hypothetical protein